MKRWLFLSCLSAAILSAAGFNELYVASTGVDSGACGARSSPCRTFQAAVNNNGTSGIITAIDAAEYGAVALPVSSQFIIDGSNVARIRVSGNGVSAVTASQAGITLRNLSLDVEDGIGVYAQNGYLTLENVKIVGLAAFVGIYADGSPVSLDRVVTSGYIGGTAVYVIGASTHSTHIRDCVFHNQLGAGFGTGIYISGNPAYAMIERSEVASFAVGIEADGVTGPAVIRINNTVISRNTQGIQSLRSGQIISFRTNVFAQNLTDGVPDLGTSLK